VRRNTPSSKGYKMKRLDLLVERYVAFQKQAVARFPFLGTRFEKKPVLLLILTLVAGAALMTKLTMLLAP